MALLAKYVETYKECDSGFLLRVSVVPCDRHSRGEAVHEAALWQLRVEISADFGEVRGQTAEEQNICPRCQPAIVEETFNSSLSKFL